MFEQTKQSKAKRHLSALERTKLKKLKRSKPTAWMTGPEIN